jgi:hypothetical protein
MHKRKKKLYYLLRKCQKMTSKTVYDYFTGRLLTVRPDPFVLDNVLSEEDFNSLKYDIELEKNNSNLNYDRTMGRFTISDEKLFQKEKEKLTSLARKIFNSETLVPSYCLYAVYRGHRANLPHHIDDNACTYTIDLCISYKTQWPIYVNDIEFKLEPNQAVCYYGEDQYHWRNKFPDPANNEVEMIFFHFIEPDHWSIINGQEYRKEILGNCIQHQKKVLKYLLNSPKVNSDGR